jgi:hypothetical protein
VADLLLRDVRPLRALTEVHTVVARDGALVSP